MKNGKSRVQLYQNTETPDTAVTKFVLGQVITSAIYPHAKIQIDYLSGSVLANRWNIILT